MPLLSFIYNGHVHVLQPWESNWNQSCGQKFSRWQRRLPTGCTGKARKLWSSTPRSCSPLAGTKSVTRFDWQSMHPLFAFCAELTISIPGLVLHRVKVRGRAAHRGARQENGGGGCAADWIAAEQRRGRRQVQRGLLRRVERGLLSSAGPEGLAQTHGPDWPWSGGVNWKSFIFPFFR